LNGLRDADFQALIDGKAKQLSNNMVNLANKLTRQLSKIPTAPEPPKAQGEQMPWEFTRDGEYSITPTLKKQSAEYGLKNKQNELARFEGERLLHADKEPIVFGLKQKGWTAWRQRMDELDANIAAAKQQINTFNKEIADIPNWTKKRQAAYEYWYNTEFSKKEQLDADYRTRYSALSELFGGLG
jgi:hypothetical protein